MLDISWIAYKNLCICEPLQIWLRYSIDLFLFAMNSPTNVWTMQVQKDTYTYPLSFMTLWKENKSNSVKAWNLKVVENLILVFKNISIPINQEFRARDMANTSSSGKISLQHFLHEFAQYVPILDSIPFTHPRCKIYP